MTSTPTGLRNIAAIEAFKGFVALLQINTVLTEITKMLSEHIKAMAREIHGKFISGTPQS